MLRIVGNERTPRPVVRSFAPDARDAMMRDIGARATPGDSLRPRAGVARAFVPVPDHAMPPPARTPGSANPGPPSRPPAARRRSRSGCSRGVTALEVLLVVAILGVLAMIALPAFQSHRDKVRMYQAVTDIGAISTLIDRYALDNQALPASLDTVGAGAMRDPWGRAYQYVNHEERGERGRWRRDKNIVPINTDFDVFSMGKDGESRPPLTARQSRDDIVRANNGRFIGLASDYDP